ncbi:unnamed protein product [Cladocopium goreaui]|uniref:Protein phosphatase n=1 Tax=Cladocopium goreaui TaxID=2562237 RepID=A0A9P1CUK0_9DINO|nr:unnamed protein product [Cladocopium goreaui]
MAMASSSIDEDGAKKLASFFGRMASKKGGKFEGHASVMLKRLRRRMPFAFGEEAEAKTDKEVENSPVSDGTTSTSTLNLGEMPDSTGTNENGAVVPRKGQTVWCRGITCDAPMREVINKEDTIKGIQETRRMSSPEPPLWRPLMIRETSRDKGLLLCDVEAKKRVEHVISTSACSTAWMPGLSEGGSSIGQISDPDEEEEAPAGVPVEAPAALAEVPADSAPAEAPKDLERSLSERQMLVREKRWSTDYLHRLSTSLDTIDPGMEKLMRIWPQDVSELLQRSVDAVLFPTAKAPSTEKLIFQNGAFSIPHPEKATPGGADSYFAAEHGLSLGVADGVGEWEWRFGINARAFADELMNGCQDHLKDKTDMELDSSRGGPSQHALQALQNGFRATKSFGSSTGLVAVLNRSGHLGVANLGDSALLLLRRKEVDPMSGFQCLARTREQQHAFNCPYQLSLLPQPEDFPALLEEGKEKLVRAMERRPKSKTDCPYDADLFDLHVQEGDLLVLGTDGVFDNLYVDEICELAGAAVGPLEADACHITEAAQIAQAVAKAAFHRSLDRLAKSPFSEHARQAGLYHTGGKMDDITCVCAWILSQS